MASAGRLLDLVFFLYFLTHIPITVFIDAQFWIPDFAKTYYPRAAVEAYEWYLKDFKDNLMSEKPAWFASFCFCEVFLQFPFFFVATKAFYQGYKRNLWIRVPCIVYASHVATTVWACLYHMMYHDFSRDRHPGPGTLRERLTLISIYSPYLIVPLLMLGRFLLGDEHRTKHKHA